MINENNFNQSVLLDNENNQKFKEAILHFQNVLNENGWQVIYASLIDNLVIAKPNVEHLNNQYTFNIKVIPDGGYVDNNFTLRYPVDSGYVVQWFDTNGSIIGVYYSEDKNSYRSFTNLLREESINKIL